MDVNWSKIIIALISILADPGDQENIVTHLHFAEIVTSVLGLRDGGHCVLKMFTFFEKNGIPLFLVI